ncbi:disulfide bond formation protein B [Primorskyibacter sp. S187A]|uniref:disulfide bond formation protein B n=1 Tax=Primorskyibacter sp. S187A TaxID=3415130 RepID=UPI003C7EBAD5
MTRRTYILAAAGGSLALLLAAFFFQALGWAPCAMCLWQRWPHAAAVAFGAIGAVLPTRLIALGGAISAATTTGLAIFHSGVERKLWDGPASCSSGADQLSGLSGNALLPGASDAPALVLCDTLTPFLFGLTMANWNALASLALMGVWIMALRKNA